MSAFTKQYTILFCLAAIVLLINSIELNQLINSRYLRSAFHSCFHYIFSIVPFLFWHFLFFSLIIICVCRRYFLAFLFLMIVCIVILCIPLSHFLYFHCSCPLIFVFVLCSCFHCFSFFLYRFRLPVFRHFAFLIFNIPGNFLIYFNYFALSNLLQT